MKEILFLNLKSLRRVNDAPKTKSNVVYFSFESPVLGDFPPHGER